MQDLREAARVALTDCAGVKPGENVVIVTDEPKRKIGLAFWEIACELGADAIFCEIIPRSPTTAMFWMPKSSRSLPLLVIPTMGTPCSLTL